MKCKECDTEMEHKVIYLCDDPHLGISINWFECPSCHDRCYTEQDEHLDPNRAERD